MALQDLAELQIILPDRAIAQSMQQWLRSGSAIVLIPRDW
jgi:hypothetical protein